MLARYGRISLFKELEGFRGWDLEVAKDDFRFDCRQLVLAGSPRSVILSYAEAQQVDLIVAGRHGRGGIQQLLGSTANALVHRARCEVLTVPLDA